MRMHVSKDSFFASCRSQLSRLLPQMQAQGVEASELKVQLGGRGVKLGALVLGALFLSACVAPMPATEGPPQPVPPSDERITDIANIALPTPAPVIVPDVTATINTEGSRANVRSGPSLDAPIVAKADPGSQFQVTGSSADGEWLQICCVRGPAEEEGEATETAWISTDVANQDGNAEAVPDIQSVLPEELQAQWRVEWSCGSERCEVRECDAMISAQATESDTEQWLQVEHNVVWDDACFDPDSWVFEVDRFTGKERSGAFEENFLYNYWLGVQPGPPTNIYRLDSGRQVAVWCSGPQDFEEPESDGWVTVYEGSTCYDVRTGELVSLSYTKRWLFSGEFDGQRYERAYFGDYESLEQYLVETNVDLYYIN